MTCGEIDTTSARLIERCAILMARSIARLANVSCTDNPKVKLVKLMPAREAAFDRRGVIPTSFIDTYIIVANNVPIDDACEDKDCD